tara:strand:+ start:106 stop:345 length:240 start_codon:yes stop_codon:yes gene_type:complete
MLQAEAAADSTTITYIQTVREAQLAQWEAERPDLEDPLRLNLSSKVKLVLYVTMKQLLCLPLMVSNQEIWASRREISSR